MYSHRQASQQCRFSRVEQQDYDNVLERQLNTSPKLYLFPEDEEKEKQLRQYEVIESDEPPKPKGKKPPGAKERIRQQDKTFLHSASGYSPTFILFNNNPIPTTCSEYLQMSHTCHLNSLQAPVAV